MIPVRESGTSSTKHAANWPFGLPAFTRQGVLGTNSRSSITSLIAAKNLSLFSASLSAAETWPTTRRTMSVHSSIARPFESFSEYRLLITRFALSPSGCDFRLGETEGDVRVFTSFLPIAALICSAFLAGRPARVIVSFKNGPATRIVYAALTKMCSGYPGWLYSKATKPSLESSKGACHCSITRLVSRRSGIYSFASPVSICCGHLFFQCSRVCYLILHLKY